MLTEFQKQKLPRLFALHDLNRDGVISRPDFEEYARRIASTRGWGLDSPEFIELRSRFLTFWDGLEKTATDRGAQQVTLTEWNAHWDQILSAPGMYAQIAEPIGRMVFTILDQDGDGAVTADEYAATFRYGGLNANDAESAFARLDLDHDGRLSVEEIMTLLDQYFRSNDPSAPGNALFGLVPGLEVSAR